MTSGWEGWIRSGVTVPDRAELDRQLHEGSWAAPAEVRLHGEHLRWSAEDARWVTPPSDLLDRLTEITAGDVDAVVKLARDVGPLGTEAERFAFGRRQSHPVNQEPTALWFRLADRARATLDVLSGAHLGEEPLREAWDIAWPEVARALPAQVTLDAHRILAAHLINQWLKAGQVLFRMTWSTATPSLEPSVNSTFGTIAFRLSLTALRVEEFVQCASCGRGFAPNRRPAPGRRAYCKECGRQAAVREAARRYRQRKAAEPE